MDKVKNKDFVEIEYTGKTKEDGIVFDTTDEKLAKDNEMYREEMSYGPVVICIGENQVIAGLDKALEGKEPGNEYTIELSPDEGFGKKSAKLVQLMSTSKFTKQNIMPVPGLQVNIDGMMGIIKTVSGGRILVDFNHPLASRTIVYNVKINKIIEDDKEKLLNYLKLQLGDKDITVDVKEDTTQVKLKKEMVNEVKEALNKKIAELIPSIKKIEFIIEKEQKK